MPHTHLKRAVSAWLAQEEEHRQVAADQARQLESDRAAAADQQEVSKP